MLLYVNRSIFISEKDKNTLFIKNIAENVTEDDLRGLFDDAVEIRLAKNKQGPGHRG